MVRRVDGSTFEGNTGVINDYDMETVKVMYGPPFPKIKKYIISEEVDNSQPEVVKYTTKMQNDIVFYSDETFTVKETIPFNRHVPIYYFNSDGAYEVRDISVSKRVDTYPIGITTEKRWYQGDKLIYKYSENLKATR